MNRNLDGEQVGAAPKQSPDHVPPEVLGLKDRPKGHYDMVNSYDDVIRDLQARARVRGASCTSAVPMVRRMCSTR